MSLPGQYQSQLENDYETLSAMIEDFGNAWGQEEVLKALRSRIEELETRIVKRGICVSCFGILEDAKLEQREGGMSESITTCHKCGAIYSGGMTT